MESINNSKLPQVVEVSTDVLFQEIEGEGVLLNLENEQYFGLNELGTRIWHLLAENGETDKTIKNLLKEYNVEELKLKNDLIDLINKLSEQGLVSIKK